MPEIPAFDEPLEPEPSSWDAVAEEAWPGGPGASRPTAPPPRRQASGNGVHGQAHDPWSAPRDEKPVPRSRPIYVWNPGAATENLPVVPPGENHKK